LFLGGGVSVSYTPQAGKHRPIKGYPVFTRNDFQFLQSKAKHPETSMVINRNGYFEKLHF
jgi:hypothetical protein